MEKQKCTLRLPLKAALRDYHSNPITFQPGDGLWWDPSKVSDPVVFEAGGLAFTADRRRFLECIQEATGESTALSTN